MNNETIGELILMKMNKEPKNTIFTVSDFYDLGSKSAVKIALFRMANEGLIHRLIDGYYVIPYFSELIQEYGYPSVDDLAKKIANKFSWTIAPCGENALNQVGLSTQVPVTCEYVSDGPYREYQYRNRIIKFKHTSNRNITKYSPALSLIIQSIKALGEYSISDDHVKKMSQFAMKYIHDDLTKETKTLPAWIYQTLKEIKEEMNDI